MFTHNQCRNVHQFIKQIVTFFNIRKLLSAVLLLVTQVYAANIYALTFDWETATDNGATVSQTVSGYVATVSTSNAKAFVQPGGGQGGTSGNFVGDEDTNIVSMTVTFSAAVDLTSLRGYDISPPVSNEWVFTPTGGSNSVVNQVVGGPGATVNLNWFGVTSFTITSPTAGTEGFIVDDIVFTPSLPPEVQSIAISGAPAAADATITYTVTFDENANDVSTDDFSVTTVSGSATGQVASVSSATGTSIDVTVNNITGAGDIRLDLNANTDITDDTGNGNGTNGSVAAFTVGVVHTVDRVAPQISRIDRLTPSTTPTNADTLIWQITFDESVNNIDATDFSVSGTTASLGVSASTGTSVDVTASGGDLANVNANVVLSLAGGQDLTDSVGNALTNTVSTGANNNDYTVDNTKPAVAITAPAKAGAAFGITVTFDESVSNLISGDITAVNGNVSAFAGSGTTYTATVTPISTLSNVGISVAAGVAQDGAGNDNTASPNVTVLANTVGSVAITGGTVVGQTLTATVTDDDVISNAITYQWMSGGSNVGSNINTYTLLASDEGKMITVNATYVDDIGANENVTSTATAAVIGITTEALNTISATANNSGSTAPSVIDYNNAGVSDVTTQILALVNIAVANAVSSADVDSAVEIQVLVDVILNGQDADGDGIPGFLEGAGSSLDTDGDGVFDFNDQDSDNDGITDALEAGIDLTDSDNDGIADVFDSDIGNDNNGTDVGKTDANFDGVDDSFATILDVAADQDGDGIPNHLDLDSDNDSVLDITETGGLDANADGLLDATGILATAPLRDDDAGIPATPNYLDIDSDGTNFDIALAGYTQFDSNNDGIVDNTADVDSDGILDVVDNAIGVFGSASQVVASSGGGGGFTNPLMLVTLLCLIGLLRKKVAVD